MVCPYKFCVRNCPMLQYPYANPQFDEDMRIPPQSNPITVTTIQKNYKKPFIQADLRIPEFHGIANTKIQDYINNSIMSDVTEFSDQMSAAAQENGSNAQKNKEKFIPYVISSIYQLTYNKNNVISLVMVYYELVQGRNNFIKVPYNYDITTGKSLMLKDLFVPGTNYKQLINNEVLKQLEKNKQNYFPGTAENFKGIAEDQPFYLKDGNLEVFFGFNQIAPTAAGIPVFEIPLSSFGNALKPAFRQE